MLMVSILINLSNNNRIYKKILLEDRIDTYLHKPLTLKKYKKINKFDFTPYMIKTTSELNKNIFDKFEKFYAEKSIEKDYGQPEALHIVFLNKATGYIGDADKKSYSLALKNDPILFTIND